MRWVALLGIGFVAGLVAGHELDRCSHLLPARVVNLGVDALVPPVERRATATCDLGVVVARREVDVAARHEGAVEAVAVAVGAVVVAGELLARLDVQLMDQELAAARAARSAAEAEARRRRTEQRRLASEHQRRGSLEDILSPEELARSAAALDEAGEQVNAADAEIERLEATISQLETRVARAEIRAPFAGRVARRYLDPGAHATAGTPIVRLISDGDWRVRFAMDPGRDPLHTNGGAVVVAVPERDQRLPGTVTEVAPEIDPVSGYLFAEARLDRDTDRTRLRAGEVVWVGSRGGHCTEPER